MCPAIRFAKQLPLVLLPTTVVTVVSRDAAAAAPAAASVLISCFIFISNFQILMLDLNLDFYFVALILHIGVGG